MCEPHSVNCELNSHVNTSSICNLCAGSMCYYMAPAVSEQVPYPGATPLNLSDNFRDTFATRLNKPVRPRIGSQELPGLVHLQNTTPRRHGHPDAVYCAVPRTPCKPRSNNPYRSSHTQPLRHHRRLTPATVM